MPRRKRICPSCGRKGYGKICHYCEQQKAAIERQERTLNEKRQKKKEWEATFEQDPIDLRALPDHVVVKARNIIMGLSNEQNYRYFGGKRLRHNRQIISIPVTRNYRMICRNDNGNTLPLEVLSHEDYNVCKPGG
ncbi:MAG: hypothetical protein F6J93_17405 [Oscillatoria sp. SIO1A7]|nr:hypothetical protein [Oscillatoria sp. SIO1A7]